MVAKSEQGQSPSSLEEERSPQRYALLSVSDKAGIVDLAHGLKELGFTIISTGGTGRVLKEKRVSIVPIEEITGFPEAFDSRMKSISFPVESGILFDRQNPKHVQQARAFNIPQIDIVICNLYPIEETIKRPDVIEDEAIKNIDVGGPTMIRAAAKNYKSVLVVVDPADYEMVIEALKTGNDSLELRRQLAAKAFHYLSFHDSIIARYLSGRNH